jgi:hypothetical protein
MRGSFGHLWFGAFVRLKFANRFLVSTLHRHVDKDDPGRSTIGKDAIYSKAIKPML